MDDFDSTICIGIKVMSEWCRVEFLRENVFWYMMQRENEILEDRHGLKRAREDQAKAEIFEQFRKAAEAGDADAQNDVGFLPYKRLWHPFRSGGRYSLAPQVCRPGTL